MRNTRKRRVIWDSGVNDRMKRAVEDSLRHGNYFFTEDTVEFWNTRIVAGMFPNDTFVTSEDNYNRTKILYTARRYDWDTHDVETIGGFQQFTTAEEATLFAKYYEE